MSEKTSEKVESLKGAVSKAQESKNKNKTTVIKPTKSTPAEADSTTASAKEADKEANKETSKEDVFSELSKVLKELQDMTSKLESKFKDTLKDDKTTDKDTNKDSSSYKAQLAKLEEQIAKNKAMLDKMSSYCNGLTPSVAANSYNQMQSANALNQMAGNYGLSQNGFTQLTMGQGMMQGQANMTPYMVNATNPSMMQNGMAQQGMGQQGMAQQGMNANPLKFYSQYDIDSYKNLYGNYVNQQIAPVQNALNNGNYNNAINQLNITINNNNYTYNNCNLYNKDTGALVNYDSLTSNQARMGYLESTVAGRQIDNINQLSAVNNQTSLSMSQMLTAAPGSSQYINASAQLQDCRAQQSQLLAQQQGFFNDRQTLASSMSLNVMQNNLMDKANNGLTTLNSINMNLTNCSNDMQSLTSFNMGMNSMNRNGNTSFNFSMSDYQNKINDRRETSLNMSMQNQTQNQTTRVSASMQQSR